MSAAGATPDTVAEVGEPVVVEVRKLLAAGRSQEALKQVRRIHRDRGSGPGLDELVVEVYLARIKALLERGLLHEARSLLDLLWERHPSTHEDRTVAGLRALYGDVGPMIAPLTDADLSQAEREAIHESVERLVVDTRCIEKCGALPEDHPLHRAAAAVAGALEAVASGPVDPATLSLPEVSRRSPMAGWKSLARAIALAYRGEAKECRRHLAMIPANSAARHAASAVASLLGEPASDGSAAVAALVESLNPDQTALRRAIEVADRALRTGTADCRYVRRLVRQAVKACERVRPDLVETLRQNISVLGVLHDWRRGDIAAGLGKPARKDARFWRLLARAMEENSDVLPACEAWAAFLRHAVHEQWFAEHGPEARELLLRMAALLEIFDAPELEERCAWYLGERSPVASLYADQPAEIRALAPDDGPQRDTWFLSPHELYDRATSIGEPDRELYERWLGWASKLGLEDRRRREAAEAWHDALVWDVPPLLELATLAECRGALKKASDYLESAEVFDELNPAVREARLRVAVAIALRHAREGKVRLLEKDLAALRDMPQALEGDRPAIVEAVEMVHHLLAGSEDAAAEARRHTAEILGHPAGAEVVIRSVAGHAGNKVVRRLLQQVNGTGEGSGSLLESVGRACAIVEANNLDIAWPSPVLRMLDAELSGEVRLQPHLAEPLARGLLSEKTRDLALAAAGAGLRECEQSPLTAQLLLLRAASRRPGDACRAVCALAAGVLARQCHDGRTTRRAFGIFMMELAPWDRPGRHWHEGMDEKQVRAVIEQERRDLRGDDPSAAPTLPTLHPKPPRELPAHVCHELLGEEVPLYLARPYLEARARFPDGEGAIDLERLGREDSELMGRLATAVLRADVEGHAPWLEPIGRSDTKPKRHRGEKRKRPR